MAAQKLPTIDPNQLELFREFLKLQSDEIGLKKQQFELSSQEQRDGHEYAKLALNAQATDRNGVREHQGKQSNKAYLFIGFLVLIFLVFCGFCIHSGKEDIVKEMGQTLVMIVGSGAGGYAICLGRMKKSEKQDDGSSAD